MNFLFFLVTLFVISFHSEKADAMNIQCEFKNGASHGYGSRNGCEVQSVTLPSSEDREITSVDGDDAKTYADVWWFQSHRHSFNNFPKNIKKFFPNVEAVQIQTANIATLTKSDMTSLGSQLKTFNVYINKIEVLEEGLFDGNPNLEGIFLSSNKIKFVASGVFDKLPKLKTLTFYSNPCHSGESRSDRAALLTLIGQIEGKCQDLQAYQNFRNLFPTTTTTTTSTTTTTEKVKSEYELRVEELTAENAELKQQQLAGDKQHQEELQKLNEKHEAEASLKDTKKKQLKDQNEDLKKDLAAVKPCDELHEVRDSLMSKFKALEVTIEGKLDTTNKKIDTTKDMIIKSTEAKLDSTLVKPMNSLQAKMDSLDLKLDTNNGKLVSVNDTCLRIENTLNSCIL